MKDVSLIGVVKRAWIPLVVVVVVVMTGFAVSRLHGMFGKHTASATTVGTADEIVPFDPKHVEYEVFGPQGAVADINFLDAKAQPHRAKDAALPWSYTIVTTLPSVIGSVVAQGDSDTIGCRIVVNGEVKDENSVNATNAQTFCLVKSA